MPTGKGKGWHRDSYSDGIHTKKGELEKINIDQLPQREMRNLLFLQGTRNSTLIIDIKNEPSLHLPQFHRLCIILFFNNVKINFEIMSIHSVQFVLFVPFILYVRDLWNKTRAIIHGTL